MSNHEDIVREVAVTLHEHLPNVGPPTKRRQVADKIVTRLEEIGAIARCTCPIGFGSVRDRRCPRHGHREPQHTITGV